MSSEKFLGTFIIVAATLILLFVGFSMFASGLRNKYTQSQAIQPAVPSENWSQEKELNRLQEEDASAGRLLDKFKSY
jgi:cell division protein FtsN